ncbi:MAG: hypothetical protein IJL02_04285 [Methanobrevibacter sp.]|uniref:hypothetical protein n=1 Tax=Methanobrevibacter sp. TaxID=66852 RepID=UPI0025D62F15|nr:hypothetical protein [Methanobrevibacter sp.]MBQ6099064.1 hypothetical protein [Methanobrevibacter sp.]
MPFSAGGMIPDFRDILYKVAILFGAIIVIYGVLWLLVNLGVIPALVAAIFPQIVLILVGLFIIYVAYSKRNMY